MQNIRKILLVEDDPNDVELILAALGEQNLVNEIEVARDGVEALDFLYCRGAFAGRPVGNPVVILLDLKMPRMGGAEVLRHIKADEKTSMIPIVILTSSRESMDLDECYQYGVNAYVVKPLDFHEFSEAVAQTGVFWALINQTADNANGQ